ncbi:MAG TPA: PIN domain-containing protein [Terrimicrobium sp.]
MSRVHLDANVLVALSDPSLPFFATVAEAIARGDQMETSVIAWHEYARGPLLPEDQARAARLVEGRIVALTRPMAELAARLFNETGRRRASTADCLIAAAAIKANAELLTDNIADFEGFVPHGLSLLEP